MVVKKLKSEVEAVPEVKKEDKSLTSKAIQIKGKSYVQVKDRIQYLADSGKEYEIVTEYSYYPERLMWVVRATLTIEGAEYVGHAQEIESTDYKEVNFSSALENCETSAVGRACAFAGIGIVDSIASSDEVHKAVNRSNPEKKLSEKQHNYILSLLDGLDVELDAYEKQIKMKVSDLTIAQAKTCIDTLLKRSKEPKMDAGDRFLADAGDPHYSNTEDPAHPINQGRD